MKSGIWRAAALALAALGPAACGEAPSEAPSGPQAPAGVTVANARLSLPPVKGNPAAVYFDLVNGGERDLMLTSATVKGAGSAMIHQMGSWNRQVDMQEVMQQPVKAGETVKFEPGKLHVMAMNLDDTLAPGGTTEVTLRFLSGSLTFPAEIRAAGDER